MPQMASLLMEVYFCTGRPKTNNDLLQSYYDSFDSLRIIKGKGSSGQANCDSTEEWFALQQTLVEGIRCTRASSDIYFFASDDVMMSQTFILILIVFREVYGIKESKYQWSGKGSSQQQLNDFMAMEYSASNFIETLVACDLVEWRSKYCRIVKREYNPDDFTKIRKNTRKVMLKEYQEDNRNEQLTNIKAISKTAQETSFERADFTIDDEIKEGESSFTKGKKLVHGIGRKKNKTYRSTDAFHYNKTGTASKEIMKLLVFLVFWGMIVEVDSGPLATTTSTKDIFSYDLLITQQCSLTNFNRAQSCQLSQTQLEDTIRHCGFQALCKPGYKARCVNTLQGGMAHICSQEHLSCARGMWMKAWIDEKNHSIVKVQEEKCRKGTFQPSASNCYDACTHKHLNIKSIPDKYVVHSEGNHFSPIVVYCNYKKGYYNLSNKTFLNYDQEIHNPYFCWHVKQVDPHCEENKYPLPNGTCVFKCMPGECRDDHDDFICKRNCSYGASDEYQDNEIVQQNKDVDECHEKINVCKNGECQNTPGSYTCKCYAGFILDENELDCIENNQTKTQDRPTDLKQTTVTVLCITIPVVCVLICFIVIVIICKHRPCSNVSAVDNTSPASSEGDPTESVVDSPSHLTSDANHSVETNIPNGKSDTSIGRKTKHKASIEFRKDVSSVNINYYNHCTDLINLPSRKESYKGDADNSEECIALLTNDDRNDKSEARRQNGKVCWTEVGEVNDREHDRQPYATKPLLKRRESDPDLEKTRSQTQQKDFLTTKSGATESDKKNDKEFEGEGFKKDKDDTLTQSLLKSLNKCMESCGTLIYKGTLAGTVFRVGSKYVMTAFHVIEGINGETDSNFTCLENSRDVFVHFMESVLMPPHQRFGVRCAYFNKNIDVAVLELVGSTENAPAPLSVWPHDAAPPVDRSISVIGYGHENSPYQKHIEKCYVLTSGQLEDRLRDAKSVLKIKRNEFIIDIKTNGKDYTSVDRGYLGYDNDNIIKFDCYMAKGLSGGPILTNESNSVKVIGMVLGGKPEFFYNLSHKKQVLFPNKYRYEFGVKMQLIWTTILSDNPSLAKELFV